MAKQPSDPVKRLVNRRARAEYEILDKVEAGIALKGSEVKSLRAGLASIEEAYARLDGDGVVLLNFQIQPYSHASKLNHNPKRPKRLLLHRQEIKRMTTKTTIRGQTLVPLAIYFNEKGLAKVELALARGKTGADRRQDLKERDAKRDIQRAMRGKR